jgi:hypothetical protein
MERKDAALGRQRQGIGGGVRHEAHGRLAPRCERSGSGALAPRATSNFAGGLPSQPLADQSTFFMTRQEVGRRL